MATGRGVFCVGADAIPALFGWEMGVPGFAGLKLEPTPDGVLADLPGGQHGRQKAEGGGGSIHFPDGNATVARLLVRWLIPDAVPGTTQEDVGAAHVDYARLDRDGQTARIRLSSTVVNVRHDGDPGIGQGRRSSPTAETAAWPTVRARHVVMACWNMVIPYLVPELPAAQKEALVYGVKGAAGLHQRRARQLARVPEARRRQHQCADDVPRQLRPRRSRQPRRPASSADAGRSDRDPHGPARHAPRASRARTSTALGRADLLATSFETFEREDPRPAGAGRSAAAASIRRATSPPSP